MPNPPGDVPATSPDVPESAPAVGLRAALKSEYSGLFTPPRVVLTAVAINGLLMCACWFLLPIKIKDSLFSLHGPLAFPFVLAGWMLADTPATNVLAMNSEASLTALSDSDRLRQRLLSKSVVLATLVGVPAFVAAILVAVDQHKVSVLPFVLLLIVTLPFGVVAISSWLGILYPYHPRPLKWRWEQRHERKAFLRWAVLVITPYLLVPVIGLALLAPAMLIASAASGGTHQINKLTSGTFIAGCLIASALSVAAFFIGQSVAVRLAGKRQEKLDSYLRQPERG